MRPIAHQDRRELRAPGQHTRRLVLRLRMRALLTLGLFGLLTVIVGASVGYEGLGFELAELGLLCVCFAVTHWMLPLVERYDRGARGEERVGAILAELRGWFVLHDVELVRSNVDHIAIGPGGVFTIETKSNPGPIRVARLHGRLIRQVHLERARVQALLAGWGDGDKDVMVEPLLVYSRAHVDRPGRRRKGIRVLEARMLPSFLDERPHVLDDATVARVLAALIDAPLPHVAGPSLRRRARRALATSLGQRSH